MLDLSLGLVLDARTQPIAGNRVAPEGVRFNTTCLLGSELYWRQLKFGEFDVADLSTASFLIAVDRGFTDWVALPVFSLRKFFQTWPVVRRDAGIEQPTDLHGKRVGVPEYQQSSAVWTRGILQHEHGVDWHRINWVMERPPNRSHGGATGFSAPPGITLTYVPESTTLAELLLAGELDATLSNLAVPNLVDRGSIDVRQRPEVRPLFDTAAESVRYYRKTGIFPFNHCVVIRRALVEQHPGLPQAIFRCFVQAKDLATQALRDNLAPYRETGLLSGEGTASDPVPYGLAANRVAIETLSSYLYEQGLTSRLISPEEAFADPS